MSEFIVKTHNNRNLIIEADKYSRNSFNDFEFVKDGQVVATVPNQHDILAIVTETNARADFYFSDHEVDDEFHRSEPELDDVCIDCRNQEFLESEDFWAAVWGIIDAWHEPEDHVINSAETPPITAYKDTEAIQ